MWQPEPEIVTPNQTIPLVGGRSGLRAQSALAVATEQARQNSTLAVDPSGPSATRAGERESRRRPCAVCGQSARGCRCELTGLSRRVPPKKKGRFEPVITHSETQSTTPCLRFEKRGGQRDSAWCRPFPYAPASAWKHRLRQLYT